VKDFISAKFRNGTLMGRCRPAALDHIETGEFRGRGNDNYTVLFHSRLRQWSLPAAPVSIGSAGLDRKLRDIQAGRITHCNQGRELNIPVRWRPDFPSIGFSDVTIAAGQPVFQSRRQLMSARGTACFDSQWPLK
jgi:hypothetical protein